MPAGGSSVSVAPRSAAIAARRARVAASCAGASSRCSTSRRDLERMARIVGKDALPPRQQLTLLCAELVNEAFLRQSAFSEIDRYCEPGAAGRDDATLGRFIELAEAALRAGVAPDAHRRARDRCARCSAWARRSARTSSTGFAAARSAHRGRVPRAGRIDEEAACALRLVLSSDAATRDRRAAAVPAAHARRGSERGGGGARRRRPAAARAHRRARRGVWSIECSNRRADSALRDVRRCASSASRCSSRWARGCSGASSTASASRSTAARRSPARKRMRIEGAADQSGRARSAARFHRDRDHRDRPDEQPGARAEAAALLRRRPAARPHRGRDRAATRGCGGAGAERLRHRLRRHRRAARQRRVLPPRLEETGALERTALFLNLASDSSDAAPADAALRADRGRVPRRRRRQARARHPDRHDQLLRGAARGVGAATARCRAARAIRATCIPTSPRSTSAPAACAAPRARSRSCRS